MQKVTKKDIRKKIVDIQYIHIPGTTVTICSIMLENGFSVRGESACVDPENFDEVIGADLAYKDAFNKIWQLEGYLLAERIFHVESEPHPRLDFGWALQSLRNGGKVQRSGWNGKGLWLELQVPDEHSKMTLPYIFMSYPVDAKTTPGARVPWHASQTDILAEDWQLV